MKLLHLGNKRSNESQDSIMTIKTNKDQPMKIKLLLLTFLIFLSGSIFAQQNHWFKTSEKNLTELRNRGARVSKFKLFDLKKDDFRNQLSKAPSRDAVPLKKGILINFPDADGNFETYEVLESTNMHPDLQSRYADIKSYTGMKVGDPLSTVRFTYDPYFGLSASFKNEDGMFYAESYTKDNLTYIIYDRKDAVSLNNFQCLVEENAIADQLNFSNATSKNVIDGLKRRYRLAITTSTEYSDYIANQAGVGTGTDAQKKTAILAAVNLAVARLNQVFENDLAVRLILIPNTDLLFFLTTDTFTVPNTGQMLGENNTVTNAIIGAANYDLGHIFYQGGGGGLASLSSICGGGKAGGVTGTDVPVADPFVIDYVAHEMGHQMGGNHTQNNGCNRSNNNAVEPGSASTIMGYAGICAPDVQGNSDAYFHANSIREMYTTITGSGNCGNNSSSGNSEPAADAGLDRTIPKETPFALTGTATDPDGDKLTYSFEQMDRQIAQMPPRPTNGTGPMFRSVKPTTSPTRYFPKLTTIVQGYDPTVINPNDYRAWEKLSAVGRFLNFSLLVRDNNAFGGQSKRDDVIITVLASAGPFIVTSQDVSDIVWELDKPATITWNVANTVAPPIKTPFVTILLSLDNGLTFPHIIVAKTENDGSYTYNVPKGLGKTERKARIMIKAIDNVFLNVNKIPFSINSTEPDLNNVFTFPDIVVYPVPSYDGIVYIRGLTTEELTYSIYAMDGKIIVPKKTLAPGDVFERIDLSGVPNAAYIIKLENETGSITKKLIIAK